WDTDKSIAGNPLIIISKELWRFDDPELTSRTVELAPLEKIWSYGQGQGIINIPYYYKIVQMK
ncbi:MAG: hypothetical protein PSV35_07930, partial [bacterium]|nr:hypothetical protein [bacterium]